MSSRLQGLRTWLLQRLSAFYMLVYALLAITWFAGNSPLDYASWLALLGNPLVNILSQLFIYLLLAHAWIGVRDIFFDYVQHLPSRFILLTLATALQIGLGLWVFMTFYGVVKL